MFFFRRNIIKQKQTEILKVFEKVETYKKYEETDLEINYINQQIKIFKVFEKKRKQIKNMRKWK